MVSKKFEMILALALLLVIPNTLFGKEKPAKKPSMAEAASFNLTGTWNFQTSDPKEYGVCDVGTPYSGKLTIAQKDSHLTLTMEAGPVVCTPAAVCSYHGVLKGNEAKFFNTTVGEGEGQTLMNTIDLTVTSKNSASGEVRSIKQFLGGSMCEWVHKIQLTR